MHFKHLGWHIQRKNFTVVFIRPKMLSVVCSSRRRSLPQQVALWHMHDNDEESELGLG